MSQGIGSAQQKPREQRRRRKFRLSYVAVAILMALFAFAFVNKIQETRRLATERAALQYQNDQTQQQNASLQRAARYEKTNGYVEAAARAEFGYVQAPEVSIEVKPVTMHPRPHPTLRPAPARPAPPVWQQWWHAFFG
jgi:cell division protein FtsB